MRGAVLGSEEEFLVGETWTPAWPIPRVELTGEAAGVMRPIVVVSGEDEFRPVSGLDWI